MQNIVIDIYKTLTINEILRGILFLKKSDFHKKNSLRVTEYIRRLFIFLKKRDSRDLSFKNQSSCNHIVQGLSFFGKRLHQVTN